jgi:hypothetical protein
MSHEQSHQTTGGTDMKGRLRTVRRRLERLELVRKERNGGPVVVLTQFSEDESQTELEASGHSVTMHGPDSTESRT